MAWPTTFVVGGRSTRRRWRGYPHGVNGPHNPWGRVLFTVAAGIGVFVFVVLPLVGGLGSSPSPTPSPVPTATARPTPTPSPRVVAPTADQLKAELVETSAPAEVAFGSTVTVTVTFRNTGTARWLKGTPAEVRLGITGDDGRLAELGMAVDWPSATRPAVQEQLVVEPGQTGRFTFRLRGAARGAYELRLQPVVEGVAWMEAEARARVTVR